MVPLLPSEVEEPYTLPDIGSLMPGDTTLFYSAIPLQGEVGVPRPYSVSGDNAISILLLSCIVLTAVIIAQARWLVVEKTKEFFLTAHDDDYDVLTASAVFYLPLLLFCSLALSVGWYVMAGSQLPEGIHLPPIAIVGGFAAVLMLRPNMVGIWVGMSIAVNRYSHIRGALLYNAEVAKLAREHNDANVAIFGARMFGQAENLELLKEFLGTDFSNDERHVRRIAKINSVSLCK